MCKLAINGGRPIRVKSFPAWPVWDEKEQVALNEVLHSGVWGIRGRKQAEFEGKFAEYQQARHGVLNANGTVSLEIALRAADIGFGDEVIVPAYTFMATAAAVMAVNAIPVFADIEPDTYCLDPNQIAAKITERTRAVIPVHIGGRPADMDEITKIAKKHGLVVIEDAAQAHGAEWKGRRVGAIGDLGVFSFQSSKNMAAGEGGIILTDNEELYERCWAIHNCGRSKNGPWYQHDILGLNYRLTEFQAAILLVQLGRLDEQMKKRTENAGYLADELNKIGGISPLRDDQRITRQAHYIYITRYEKEAFKGLSREKFLAALNKEGIPAFGGYGKPLYQEKFLQRPGKTPLEPPSYADVNLPVTEKACNEEGVWFQQVDTNVLLGTRRDMDDIVAAIRKIKENVDELL